MSIEAGNKIPEATLRSMSADGIQDISTKELFEGKKVVVFAVPGAFTPTCSDVHLPGFVSHMDDFTAKGVDTVACLAVNDPFVMGAWQKQRQIPQSLKLLSDGNGDFVEALGLVLDASGFGMGKRSRRFAMVVDNGTVTYLGVEPAGEVGVSGAEAVLEAL